MDAIKLLKQQHRDVEKLFSSLEEADAAERPDLFAQLADAFMVHCHIEEELFYPAVYADRTEDELREAVEEHLQSKRIIADMLDLDSDDEQWKAKCSVLEEDIKHHVEEEEKTLFPMVQKDFTKRRLDDLGRKLSARTEELQSEGEARSLVYDEIDEARLPV